MFSRLVIAIAVLGLSACERQASVGAVPFRLTASHRPVLPDYVVLKLINDGDDFLCVSLSETRLGNMRVLPPSADDHLENRPPERLLGDLDILEGLAVLPPRKDQTILVSVEELKGREPRASELRGTIRGASCQGLFSGSEPKLTERSFIVRLLPIPKTR